MKALHTIIRQKEASEDSLLSLPGVNGVDVGYKYVNGQRTDEIAIRVQVDHKKKNVSPKEKIPDEINGIKTDVIQRKVVPLVASKPIGDVNLLSDAAKYSPVKGGISIGPERVINGYVYVGTLGCIVKDNANNQPLLLSNFHVMCVDNGWHVGDFMCQPGRVDGGVPVTDRIGALNRAVLSSHVDGAVCSLSGRTSDCSVVDIGDVKGTANAVLNAPVRKRGRTTLLTYGFVDAVSATVNVDYGDGLGTKTLTDQIGIRADATHNAKFSDHGDSGSVVMDGDAKIIGLLFAGSDDGYTYINPISSVLSELNIKICTKTKTILKDHIKDKDIKDVKNEKLEIKEKNEKLEIKEKNEKIERKELKDVKAEKLEKLEFEGGNKKIFENDPKGPLENPQFPGPGGQNPGSQLPGMQGQQGGLEQRLAQLEQLVGQLTAFISQELRPDLSSGALQNESDWNRYSGEMEQQRSQGMGAKTEYDTKLSDR